MFDNITPLLLLAGPARQALRRGVDEVDGVGYPISGAEYAIDRGVCNIIATSQS